MQEVIITSSEKMSDYVSLKNSKLVSCIRQEYVGKNWVSTAYVKVNYSGGFGPPEFFETMVFDDVEGGGEKNEYTRKYVTLEEAIQGHEEIVAELKKQE